MQHNRKMFNEWATDGSESKEFNKSKFSKEMTAIRLSLAKQYGVNKDICDLGCGQGYFTYEIAKVAKSIVGVDFAEVLLAKAPKGKNIKYIHADITKLPLKDNSVDLVYSYSTLYYIKEILDVVYHINRVLRYHGIAILEFGNKDSINTRLVKRQNLECFHISISAMYNILEFYGFEVLEHRRFQVIMSKYFSNEIQRTLSFKIKGRMLDQIISEAPIIKDFAFRNMFVVRKVK